MRALYLWEGVLEQKSLWTGVQRLVKTLPAGKRIASLGMLFLPVCCLPLPDIAGKV